MTKIKASDIVPEGTSEAIEKMRKAAIKVQESLQELDDSEKEFKALFDKE